MTKYRVSLGISLLVGLIGAGAIAAAAAVLLESEPVAWQAVGIDLQKGSSGEQRLVVRGERLPDDLKALLVPQAESGQTKKPSGRLSFSTYHLDADGRLAVATTRDRRLVVFDIATEQDISVVGGITLPPPRGKRQNTFDLALLGSKVVVACGHDGLFLVDVADPKAPRQLDFLPLPEKYYDLKADGEIIYLAAFPRELYVIKVVGERLQVRKIPDSPQILKLAVNNHRLISAGPGGELTFFETGRQGLPGMLGKTSLPGEVRDLIMTEETLYVCTADGSLMEFSLRNWPQVTLTAKVDLKGRPVLMALMGATRQLFCRLIGSGVAVVDVSIPGRPRFDSVVPLKGTVVRMKTAGRRLLLTGQDGLRILNADDLHAAMPLEQVEYPVKFKAGSGSVNLLSWDSAVLAYTLMDLQPMSAGSSAVPVQPGKSAAKQPFLALPDPQGVRLHRVAAGRPSSAVFARIPIHDEAWEVSPGLSSIKILRLAWRDDRLFVLTASKVSVFRVADSGSAELTEAIPVSGGAVDMALLPQGCLVVATLGEGLTAFDVSRPEASRLIRHYPFPRLQQSIGNVKGVLNDGPRLFVARGRLGVEIYDFSKPEDARLLQRIDTPGYAWRFALGNDLLMVADREKGLFIIDMRGGEAVAVGSYQLPFYAMDIQSDADALFLANSAGGVLRLPLPRRLTETAAVSDDRLELVVPSGSPPRPYNLALYDDRLATSLPVTLQ